MAAGKVATVAAALTVLAASPLLADQVISDDLIVVGNACIGFDCSINVAFPENGVMLKENNNRVSFNDGAFILVANQSANESLNEFRIDTIVTVNRTIASTVTASVIVPNSAVTLMPDGTLRIDLSIAPNAIVVPLEEDLTDYTFQIEGQYAYVPAGGFTDYFGIGYSLTPGLTVTSDAGTSFTYTASGSLSNIRFAPDGTGVTLGRGSARVSGAVSVGAAGAERRVTEVADAVADNDLINMRQLRATFASLDLSPAISAEASRLDGVSAMSAAISAIQPNPRAKGPLATSIGFGYYDGETAVAMGVTWQASNAALLKLSFADSDKSSPMTAISLNFAW